MWGGWFLDISQQMSGFSDPTRVGWITARDIIVTLERFRPHACGVDDLDAGIHIKAEFQTPRVWGGSLVVA